MEFEGNLLKMRSLHTSPVNYFLPVGMNEIDLNPLIGKEIKMWFTGQINCISCGKKIKTSYRQGFCYKCLQTAPEAGESIIRPELSKSQFGITRDVAWSEKHDLIDHIVYLAVTSDLKVGVTRHYQIPDRWIDQGASYAIKVARTPNRHIAGIIEVFFKKYYHDKTTWQAMLSSDGKQIYDLLQEKKKALQRLPAELQKYCCDDNDITAIQYPLNHLPDKMKRLNFDKTPSVGGILKGIKGQYLIFENDEIINIRKHNGYFIQFSSSL